MPSQPHDTRTAAKRKEPHGAAEPGRLMATSVPPTHNVIDGNGNKHQNRCFNADTLKARIREVISPLSDVSELFFYFTGHGSQQEGDFYFCATSFDGKRPNETGLSTSELHILLRMADADLVVKVIDPGSPPAPAVSAMPSEKNEPNSRLD